MKFFGLIPAALCALSLALPGPSYSSSFSGLTVTQIVLQDDAGRTWPKPEQVTPLLNVKAGDRFSSAAIREGIAYLYLKGLFRDIRIESFPDAFGVKLVYTLVPITVVDRVVITGNHVMSATKLMDAIPGVEGRELREDKFPELRDTIATLYQSAGYYDTGVVFQAKKLKAPHRIALQIGLLEPKPTIISSLTFTGNTVLTDKQLLKVMENRPGRPLRSNVLLDTDTPAIIEKYSKAGHPGAKAGPVAVSFREGKASVVVTISEGPNVTVRFSGNDHVWDRTLRKQVLIWSEHDVSDAIMDSSADKIKNLYKDRGYANAKVEVKKTEGTGTLDLVFGIQEGPRITLKEITISGNQHFSTKEIKAEMLLRESGWFTSKPFREDLLDKDLDYLADRYMNDGFLNTAVEKKVEFQDNGTRAVVSMDIKEGEQTRVGQVGFEGNTVFTAEELLAMLGLRSGAPYNEHLTDEDRYHILSAYSNRGYLYARVEVEKKIAEGTADIKYKISEDRLVSVGRIILRGNERTKEPVIMREVLVKPGDPYDYGKILASQQRIYRLGYFGQARFEPVRPGEKEYVKDLLLSVEERPAGAVEVGGGYGDLDRARGFAEVSYRNLWGSADYASLRVEGSTILKRAAFSYQQPWVLGYDVKGIFGLEWSDSKRLNQDSREIYYQTRRASVSYGIEKTFDRLKASLTYQQEKVDNYNVEPGAVLSPQDIGYVRVSSISPALVWDLRDDIFNPRKGALYGIVVKQAMNLLGSEADFTKVSVHSSWYIPLSPSIIGALSARVGMAWPHGETIEVPLHERFYAGGSTTVRGYTQDSVGPSAVNPDGTTTPTGGPSMAIFNVELRLNPSEGFGFVLFSDAGNVWNYRTILLDDLRESYGVGIRYGTPVGPLRVDYGQKIHRRPGESAGEVHFNIGHTF
jgi:outer membrane protein insertion porin family